MRRKNIYWTGTKSLSSSRRRSQDTVCSGYNATDLCPVGLYFHTLVLPVLGPIFNPSVPTNIAYDLSIFHSGQRITIILLYPHSL